MKTPILLASLGDLRRNTAAKRRGTQIEVGRLSEGYYELLSVAPKRTRPFFSSTRTGIPPVDPFGRRKEERLAMAWFGAGRIDADGHFFRILDYQFPLKSAKADAGIGKIDLLAQSEEDQTLAIIELKVATNKEDRRIAVLESLIYSAIIEANAATIAQQLMDAKGVIAHGSRPKILIAAPSGYWRSGTPALAEIEKLSEDLRSSIPIEISLLQYQIDENQDYGLSGQFRSARSSENEPNRSAIRLSRAKLDTISLPENT